MLKAAPYQTDFPALILDPAGIITESGTTRFKVSALNDAVSVMVNNALKQITQGATDSGGTGFRVLRVPN